MYVVIDYILQNARIFLKRCHVQRGYSPIIGDKDLFIWKVKTGKQTKDRLRQIDSHSDRPVRVKGGMSLWHGMWHDLRNGIIMRNVILAE